MRGDSGGASVRFFCIAIEHFLSSARMQRMELDAEAI